MRGGYYRSYWEKGVATHTDFLADKRLFVSLRASTVLKTMNYVYHKTDE